MSGLSGRGGRLLVVVLLLLATAAFGTGVAIEKSRPGHSGAAAAPTDPESGETHAEGEPTAEGTGGESHSDESVLGIDAESTPLVILAVVASMAAAAAVWLVGGRRSVLEVVALFCLAFATLDAVEFARKAGDEAGIALLALAAAVLHAGAAAMAAVLASRAREAQIAG